MKLAYLFFVALYSLPVFAQGIGDLNLTVTFFADNNFDSCQANDIAKSIVLTTTSVPTMYTCFNVKDIFSQSNNTGFKNATSPIWDADGNLQEPNGVAWLLKNREDFDPRANYSHVWYEQNDGPDVKAGDPARRVFYIYAYENCEQMDDSDDVDPELFPWYETSCQTERGGQCRTVPYSIKSFAVNTAVNYNVGHGKCEVWAHMGSSGAGAVKFDRSFVFLVAASVTAATLFL